MHDLDDEIRAVEARIARERHGLAALLQDCGETARDAVAAPKNLLAVAMLGFVLGEALRPARPAAPPRKRGLGDSSPAPPSRSFVRATGHRGP